MDVLSRANLEGLSIQELVAIAERYDIDIPPDIDWNFVIEVLLESNLESDAEEKDRNSFVETAIPGAVPLPTHYNITFIDVVMRDPFWVFAFWEIKEQDKETCEGVPGFGGYFLRVVPVDGEDGEPFTITVGERDSAWYVGIPVSGCCYKVELCAQQTESAAILATSREFRPPKLLKLQDLRRLADENPLLCLSGVEDFRVIRNVERDFK
jgi:hypothetical protein